ncbi:hypothetical protein COT52_01225 [candidate division WWE3 bacterium CG08_land_8_20_14_0_20_43_13]|uniref:Uncharacterized protein n=1 Tax=candidate division WWE3 bacterium CG08_land_8_20_14_0_20_43_13 TaxID=1975087 RepID=A0A2H0X7Q9_UNCKA|nr:MAG: hypothetical protein COT52_01225 [candidate division WWE3 bacterium CG08_land_8_20_14_0_20_43_13]
MKGFRHLVPCGSVSLGARGEVLAMEESCPWHGGCKGALCAIKLASDLAQSNPGLIEVELSQTLMLGRTFIDIKGDLVTLDEENIVNLRMRILKLIHEIRELIAE